MQLQYTNTHLAHHYIQTHIQRFHQYYLVYILIQKIGAIPFEVYLKNSSLPYADKILSEIKQFNEAAQKATSPDQLSQLMSQTGGAMGQPTADQQTSMAMVNQLLSGREPMQRSA